MTIAASDSAAYVWMTPTFSIPQASGPRMVRRLHWLASFGPFPLVLGCPCISEHGSRGPGAVLILATNGAEETTGPTNG